MEPVSLFVKQNGREVTDKKALKFHFYASKITAYPLLICKHTACPCVSRGFSDSMQVCQKKAFTCNLMTRFWMDCISPCLQLSFLFSLSPVSPGRGPAAAAAQHASSHRRPDSHEQGRVRAFPQLPNTPDGAFSLPLSRKHSSRLPSPFHTQQDAPPGKLKSQAIQARFRFNG